MLCGKESTYPAKATRLPESRKEGATVLRLTSRSLGVWTPFVSQLHFRTFGTHSADTCGVASSECDEQD